MVSCGISTSFPVLFPSRGKVAHALLTRPPLESWPKPQSPLDLHVLGTPPAFVLSQDQTLAFNPFYLYRCLHQQDANSFGITVSCLRYSCSVSFSRFSAHRLACASRASLFILSPSQRNVNTFLQTFSLFCASFWICERCFPKKHRLFRFWGEPVGNHCFKSFGFWARLCQAIKCRLQKRRQGGHQCLRQRQLRPSQRLARAAERNVAQACELLRPFG